jgi:hypothetical protein
MPAAVCKRGHVITTNTTRRASVEERCPECGARVLTGCPECGHRIRGYYLVPGVMAFGDDYARPNFCDDCGAPFPWVGRQERIYELQNRLDDDEELDAATKLWAGEMLDKVLATDPTDEKEQRRLWKELYDHAGGFLRHPRTQRIVDTVVTEAVKRAIGPGWYEEPPPRH